MQVAERLGLLGACNNNALYLITLSVVLDTGLYGFESM